MRLYNLAEITAKGFDSGLTLAVWFSELPERIPIPRNCERYHAEYREAVISGFNHHRKILESRINND